MPTKKISSKKSSYNTLSLNVLWPVAILFGIAAIFAFINFSDTLLNNWPANDFGDHLAQITFMYESGLLQKTPYWHNGEFVPGRVYGIGFFGFAALLTNITQNARVSLVLAEALCFIFGFIGVIYIGKIKKYGLTKTLLFYFLFFFSPLAIAYFIGLGSVGSLLGWSMIMFIIAFIEKYKSTEINWKFLFVIPFYCIAILSHTYMAILSTLILFSFFLYKLFKNYQKNKNYKLNNNHILKHGHSSNNNNNKINKNQHHYKELYIIAVTTSISIVITSFWWINIIKYASLLNRQKLIPYYALQEMFRIMPRGMFFTFIIPFVFLLLLFLLRKKISKSEIVFMIFIILISFFMLTRTLSFIPIINKVNYENLCLYIYIYILFLLFDYKIEYFSRDRILKIAIPVLVIIVTVIIGLYFAIIYYYSDSFKLSETNKQAILMLEKNISTIGNNLVVVFDWYEGFNEIPVNDVINPYMAVNHNVTTSQGFWQDLPEYIYENLTSLKKAVKNQNCEIIDEILRNLKTDSILIINLNCERLEKCTELKILDKQKILSNQEVICLFKHSK
ncbi:MAG: hypothetical protein QXG00_01225 [Candidatus Woesearchaeota archaeon]